MYDPQVGRFLQEDPSDFDAGDQNLFRYTGNSPTNYTDPSGMWIYVPASERSVWEQKWGKLLSYVDQGDGTARIGVNDAARNDETHASIAEWLQSYGIAGLTHLNSF